MKSSDVKAQTLRSISFKDLDTYKDRLILDLIRAMFAMSAQYRLRNCWIAGEDHEDEYDSCWEYTPFYTALFEAVAMRCIGSGWGSSHGDAQILHESILKNNYC